MFSDLNIPIQDAEDVHSLNHRERLGMAIRLGTFLHRNLGWVRKWVCVCKPQVSYKLARRL
jgi:hypothetical protein